MDLEGATERSKQTNPKTQGTTIKERTYCVVPQFIVDSEVAATEASPLSPR